MSLHMFALGPPPPLFFFNWPNDMNRQSSLDVQGFNYNIKWEGIEHSFWEMNGFMCWVMIVVNAFHWLCGIMPNSRSFASPSTFLFFFFFCIRKTKRCEMLIGLVNEMVFLLGKKKKKDMKLMIWFFSTCSLINEILYCLNFLDTVRVDTQSSK